MPKLRFRVIFALLAAASLNGCIGYYRPYGHYEPREYRYRDYQTPRHYHERGDGYGSYRRHRDDD